MDNHQVIGQSLHINILFVISFIWNKSLLEVENCAQRTGSSTFKKQKIEEVCSVDSRNSFHHWKCNGTLLSHIER